MSQALCESELTVQFIHVLKLGSLKGQFTRRINVILATAKSGI